MSKSKSPVIDEKIVAYVAYVAYLRGRLAAQLPETSYPWASITRSYCYAARQPLESYCYAKGLLMGGGAVLSHAELLDAVREELPPEPKPRRKPRPDTRWTVQ